MEMKFNMGEMALLAFQLYGRKPDSEDYITRYDIYRAGGFSLEIGSGKTFVGYNAEDS
jgi:hypothetical protein